MRKFKLFTFLIVVFLASCTPEKSNTVIIHSSNPADSIFNEIKISSGQRNLNFKGGTTCLFDVDTVEVCSFEGSSPDSYFSTLIFITPGDSVSFKTISKGEDYYEVVFEGKNAAHYNYASEKKKAISQAEPDFFFNPDVDLQEYKKQLQDYRNKEKAFLQKYKKKYAVSEDFMNYALEEIYNEYAFKLYQAAYFKKCRTLPKAYLDDAVIGQNFLSFYAIQAFCFKYFRCSPNTDIERIYNAISTEIHPKFHSPIFSELITWFSQRGDRSYKTSLLKVMSKIERTSTDSTLLARVKEYKPYYLLSGKMLPDSILDKTYLRPFESKQKITLRQLFNSYKNTAVYLDFWASWCGGCRYTIRVSAENKSYFAEKNIEVVYISMDEDEDAWRKAAKEDNISKNQYLLLDAGNSLINSYLKISFIPRFVLFNKKHEIEILNAPRPNGCEFEELKGIIERSPEKFVSEKPLVKNIVMKKEAEKPVVINNNYEDSTVFAMKTIYHDNFGTFLNANSYVDAWGTPRTPAKNWQTTYCPYTIPSHRIIFGSPDDGMYTIGTLKKGVMWETTRGGMIKDASNNPNGAVLCINVAKRYKGVIYRQQINNFPSNAILYFEVSIANASFVHHSTPPQVEIRIEKTTGELLGNAHSNMTSATFGWQKIKIDIPPIAEKSVVLRVISTGEDWLNGCDLLMDDIIFRSYTRR